MGLSAMNFHVNIAKLCTTFYIEPLPFPHVFLVVDVDSWMHTMQPMLRWDLNEPPSCKWRYAKHWCGKIMLILLNVCLSVNHPNIWTSYIYSVDWRVRLFKNQHFSVSNYKGALSVLHSWPISKWSGVAVHWARIENHDELKYYFPL